MHICWGKAGVMYYIPKQLQENTLKDIGTERYMRLPKPNTNPRGIDMSSEALEILTQSSTTLTLPILWQKEKTTYRPYQRWIQLWQAETQKI